MSENNCYFVNFLSFAKRSNKGDYCLILTQDSQSESHKSFKFIEKSDLSHKFRNESPEQNHENHDLNGRRSTNGIDVTKIYTQGFLDEHSGFEFQFG